MKETIFSFVGATLIVAGICDTPIGQRLSIGGGIALGIGLAFAYLVCASVHEFWPFKVRVRAAPANLVFQPDAPACLRGEKAGEMRRRLVQAFRATRSRGVAPTLSVVISRPVEKQEAVPVPVPVKCRVGAHN